MRPGGCVVAINGQVSQWVGSFIGWQKAGYKLIMQEPSGGDLAATAALVEGGKLKPLVDSVFPFSKEGCEGAYAKLLSRRARGKVVVVMAPKQ